VNRQPLDELKQQIPLMGYLQAHDWHPARPLSHGRWMGLCPLHEDRKPSFLVDPNKDLFYCYGCGRGGDVIRFAELYHQVKFPQALALLRQWRGAEPLLHETARFYRMQLHRHSEAVAYLYQRGVRSLEVIEHMRIGYAPGGCLRGWLTQLGHSLPALRQAGLVTGVTAAFRAYGAPAAGCRRTGVTPDAPIRSVGTRAGPCIRSARFRSEGMPVGAGGRWSPLSLMRKNCF
jgi:DNA primase